MNVECTILTQFIGFMRVIILHKPAKFGCITSINNKTINNLGAFSAKFSMTPYG